MNLEKELSLYLVKYGDTRETDLIKYASAEFDRHQADVKRIVSRMAVRGKIHRVLHNKLKPPEVYVSLREPDWSNIRRDLIEVDDSQMIKEDAVKILEEASRIAEERAWRIR